MKKTVTVEIECGRETCNECHGLTYVDLYKNGDFVDPVCCIFNKDLGRDEDGENLRCDDCLREK